MADHRTRLNYERVISEASYLRPKHWVPPGPWNGHAPFAGWLMDALRPRTLVELGSHYGFSLFMFAEAAKTLGIDVQISAIDAWEDDNPAGIINGMDPYDTVRSIAPEYPNIDLYRAYFSEALEHFEDHSIDLLHIDGNHSYEEVKEDFETWLPKMSDRGVILFHDAYSWRQGFGVYKLWDEIADVYPSHRFTHSWGLGVLGVGSRLPDAVINFFGEASRHPQELNDVYQSLAWHNEIG